MRRRPRISSDDILKTLDEAADESRYDFPIFDDPSEMLVTSRLNVLSDGIDWALVIEMFTTSTLPIGHHGIYNTLYTYGSCITPTAHKRIVSVTADSDEHRTFYDNSDGEGDPVRPEARAFLLRNRMKKLPSRSDYGRAGVQLRSRRLVWKEELMRYFAWKEHDALLLTQSELEEQVKRTLPVKLRLDEWRHPDLSNGELPSDSVSFKAIAKVLATGDSGHYTTDVVPNTHWKKWTHRPIV